MGADTFSHRASGATAQAAFISSREEAQYDYGHAGYTGTIAEKDTFIMLPTPDLSGWDESHLDWEKVDDKWGPAGCYDLGKGQFLFFGWASS